MGYIPFVNIRHTSHEEHGQIYIPQINALLAAGCIALVLIFRSSNALASAYGIAVTLTMLATTLLLYFAARRVWKWSVLGATALCAPFMGIEFAFLAANSTKIADGGWMPLAIGGIVFLMMTTWKKGRHLLSKSFPEALPLREFVASTASERQHSALPARVSGTAVFLAGQPRGTPGSLLHNLKHNKVLHERNVVLTIRTDRIPYVSKLSRVEITDLSHGFYRVVAHFGFMETPSLGDVIEACALKDFVIEEEKTSFFLGREILVCTNRPGMARWHKALYSAMNRLAQRPAEFFKLPVNRTVELGQRVEF
jgi:KUP system potassium uptake protein